VFGRTAEMKECRNRYYVPGISEFSRRKLWQGDGGSGLWYWAYRLWRWSFLWFGYSGDISESMMIWGSGNRCYVPEFPKKKRPLHLQVSYPHPGEKIKVITLYEPNLKEWKEGFRERRG